MVTFRVVIKTFKRTPDYLNETMKNLARAGVLASPHLVRLDVHDGVGITMHQNAQRCIELAAEGDHDFAMVLEDDLDFCDNFLENVALWLEDFAVEEKNMYVLGANYSQIHMVTERGGRAWAYPVGAFYGAQALLWRRKDAEELAQWLGPDPDYNGIKNHGHDLKLQQWGKTHGIEFFTASAPCMVQHIGEQSGINNRFFQFPWGGRDWKYEKAS